MNAAIFATPGFPRGSEVLARNWWAVALRGVFAILFGLAAIFFSFATINVLILVFGAYLFADGVFAIVSGVRAATRNERWGLLILEGIVDIVAGLAALFVPGLTLLVIVAMLGAWAILTGILMAAAGFRLQRGKWWLVASGVLSIAWGVLLFIAPIAGALVLTWWLGGYTLVFGVMLLILAFRLRERLPKTFPAAS